MKHKQRDEIEQVTFDFVIEEYQSLGEKYHPATVWDIVALRVRTDSLPVDNNQAKVRWEAATQPDLYTKIDDKTIAFLPSTHAAIVGEVWLDNGLKAFGNLATDGIHGAVRRVVSRHNAS